MCFFFRFLVASGFLTGSCVFQFVVGFLDCVLKLVSEHFIMDCCSTLRVLTMAFLVEHLKGICAADVEVLKDLLPLCLFEDLTRCAVQRYRGDFGASFIESDHFGMLKFYYWLVDYFKKPVLFTPFWFLRAPNVCEGFEDFFFQNDLVVKSGSCFSRRGSPNAPLKQPFFGSFHIAVSEDCCISEDFIDRIDHAMFNDPATRFSPFIFNGECHSNSELHRFHGIRFSFNEKFERNFLAVSCWCGECYGGPSFFFHFYPISENTDFISEVCSGIDVEWEKVFAQPICPVVKIKNRYYYHETGRNPVSRFFLKSFMCEKRAVQIEKLAELFRSCCLCGFAANLAYEIYARFIDVCVANGKETYGRKRYFGSAIDILFKYGPNHASKEQFIDNLESVLGSNRGHERLEFFFKSLVVFLQVEVGNPTHPLGVKFRSDLWEQDVLRTDSFVFGFLKSIFRRPLLCLNDIKWQENEMKIAIRRYRQIQNQLRVSVSEFGEILPCMCKLCEGNHQYRGACTDSISYHILF